MLILAVVFVSLAGAGLAICWRCRRHGFYLCKNFYRQLIEAIAEPILVVAQSGQVIYANVAAARLFGYSAAELSRMKASALLIVQEDQELLSQLRRSFLADDRHTRVQSEWKGRAQDGSEFPVRLRIAEISNRRATAFVLVVHDILSEHIVELDLRRYAEQLRQTKSSLQVRNRNLEITVTERTAELARAKDAAEFANQSKTDFVNIVSHEIRSPLHGILSFAELGTDRATTLEREKLQAYFSTITRCGNTLLTLVNDLLDLSKIESGTIELNLTTIDLVEVVKQVASEADAILKNKEVSVVVNCSSDQICIIADRDKIGQVVRNLLSNALKFSPPSSQINISVVQGIEAILVAVRDQGPGIPEQDLSHIFDKFYQASNGREKCGTGLGLAICKQIVELHEGEISARNAEEGGAIVSFTLAGTPRKTFASSTLSLATCAS